MNHLFVSKRLLLGLGLFIAAGALLAAFWLGGTHTQALAHDFQTFYTSGPLAGEGDAWHSCNLLDVAAFQDRIHARCTTAPASTAIYFFAAPSDVANALSTNRYLVLLNTAFTLGKPALINYSTDSAENPPGCQAIDCRKILGVILQP